MSSIPLAPRRRAAALAALVALSASACGGTDPFAPVAQLFVAGSGYILYPLSTAPALLPSGIQLLTQSPVRPQVSAGLGLNFDVVFDLTTDGRVRVMQPKLIAIVPTGTPETGVQTTTAHFDSLLRAPNSGFQFDSAVVVRVGQVFVLSAQGTTASGITCSTTSPIYAKAVVDSIVAVPSLNTQQLYVRTVVDPNCGFRSLEPNVIPKN